MSPEKPQVDPSAVSEKKDLSYFDSDRPVLSRDAPEALARRKTGYTNIEPTYGKLQAGFDLLEKGLETPDAEFERLRQGLSTTQGSGLEDMKIHASKLDQVLVPKGAEFGPGKDISVNPVLTLEKQSLSRLESALAAKEATLQSLTRDIARLQQEAGRPGQDPAIAAAQKKLLSEKATEQAQLMFTLAPLEKQIEAARRALAAQGEKMGETGVAGRTFTVPAGERPVTGSVQGGDSISFPSLEHTQPEFTLAQKREQYIQLRARMDEVQTSLDTEEEPTAWAALNTEMKSLKDKVRNLGEDIARSVKNKTVN